MSRDWIGRRRRLSDSHEVSSCRSTFHSQRSANSKRNRAAAAPPARSDGADRQPAREVALRPLVGAEEQEPGQRDRGQRAEHPQRVADAGRVSAVRGPDRPSPPRRTRRTTSGLPRRTAAQVASNEFRVSSPRVAASRYACGCRGGGTRSSPRWRSAGTAPAGRVPRACVRSIVLGDERARPLRLRPRSR